MAESRTDNAANWVKTIRNRWWPIPRTLRAQLVLRTMLPLGLLVIAFAVVGQIAYTQVTQSLAINRDGQLARVEAARLGDYLSESAQVLQEVAFSPVVISQKPADILYVLRGEQIAERFDVVQVTDAQGKLLVSSPAGQGTALLDPQGFQTLTQPGLPSTLAQGKLGDGRPALVLSMSYITSDGKFGGVVEGGVALGSPKLGAPLSDYVSVGNSGGASQAPGAVSYLAASDGTILWHSDSRLVGTRTTIEELQGTARAPGAMIRPLEGSESLVGYAPLNLGLLLPRTAIEPQWVQLYVVTQERWQDVMAPVNSLLVGLILLAGVGFIIAISLVAQSAGSLTRPVAHLVSAVRDLSTGRLRQRVEVEGPIEIEELSHQFNSMAEQLQASYRDLEAKVEERTSELASANAELQHRLVESQTMQVVSANMVGTADLEEILQTIASSAAGLIGEDAGSVVLLASEQSPDQLVAAGVHNLGSVATGTCLPVNSSLAGRAFLTGEVQLSQDAKTDPHVNKSLMAETRPQAVLAVPLISRGQVIGVIDTNRKAGEFSGEDLRLLTLLANQAAIAIERARLYADTQQQLRALRTINELSMSVTLSRSVEETLRNGMSHIGNLLGAGGAVVYLHDRTTHSLNYTVGYNLDPGHEEILVKTSHSLPVDEQTPRLFAALEAFRTQKPYYVEDMTADSYTIPWMAHIRKHMPAGHPLTQEPIKLGAMIALPLSVREHTLGTMGLYFSMPRHFPPAEIQLYESFAKIVALAVYNTQLIAQSSKLATVEERARLARELHDSVTQSLFSLNLTLRAARRVLENDREQALRLLDDVSELAQGSLAEMRALIFELRPQALENEGLISALRKHADAVRARSGLAVHVHTQGERRLPIEIEEALYQIAREALHNVVKHAQATDAWIDLDLAGEEVTLSVRDNGRGFDPAQLQDSGGSHIGTSTMRERAESMGGTLEIRGKPGHGSEIVAKLVVPRETQIPELRSRSEESQPVGGVAG